MRAVKLMCNAWNHSIFCGCGFGGDTGGGGGYSVPTWSLFTSHQPVTHLTTCWECGAEVYFYRDEYGGCALFDELGSPWPIHSCWEPHRRSSRAAALDHVNIELRNRNYSGELDLEPYERMEAPDHERWLGPEVWVVVQNLHPFWPADRFGFNATGAGAWQEIELARDNRILEALIPAAAASALPTNTPVEILGRWLRHSEAVRFFAVDLRRPPIGRRAEWRQVVESLSDRALICSYCGGTISRDEDWGFDGGYQLECGRCSKMRDGRTRAAFSAHCRRIAEEVR